MEEKARDIDLLVVSERENLSKIRKIIKTKNEISVKPIHLLLQTPGDFKDDLRGKNKAILEIIKTGIVLFNPNKLTQIIQDDTF